MDAVKLMNRTDRKYTFNVHTLPSVLHQLLPFYRILEVAQKRISRYESLYYDTEAYQLYHAHHGGRLNRYKIRHRTYVENNLRFLEVKFKNNKGRTIKSRIPVQHEKALYSEGAQQFIMNNTCYVTDMLKPVIRIDYKRITLVNLHSNERLTIDTELEFITETQHQLYHGLVIAELKQDGNKPSVFTEVAKHLHLRAGAISKYCMGIATCTSLKSNNFKPALLQLNRINNEPAPNYY